jgi:hypothetical protein
MFELFLIVLLAVVVVICSPARRPEKAKQRQSRVLLNQGI